MVTIVDYGVGNMFSLKSSFAYINEQVTVTSDVSEIKNASRIVLPGVGAFQDAALKLKASGLWDIVIDKAKSGTPLLGICLGMQMLLDKSLEYGCHEGLGLIKGTVAPMEGYIDKDLKIPHIGWNRLKFTGEKHPVFKYINEGDYVYFVHSFYGTECEESTIAVTDYSKDLTAAVASGNVCGVQFHPEKSGDTGLKILKAFAEWEC
ncbi:MAG: imidazole glycerol phosphate synthase subunit HisH [Parasporobacterium sp.]|nr:imidazole glycerol phosphate synthase subunit HisH [Parasporobacterium sp.]